MKTYIEVLRSLMDDGDEKTDRTGTGTISKFGGMMKFSCRHNLWPIPTTRAVAWMKILEELEWMMRGFISVKWLDDKGNKIWNSWTGEETGTIGPMYGEQWRNATMGLLKLSEEDKARLNQLMMSASWNDNGDDCDESDGQVLSQAAALRKFEEFLAEKFKPYEQGGRGGTDQFQNLIDELRARPDSRRLVVDVWQAALLPDPTKSPKEEADQGKMALAPCHAMWQVNTAPLSKMDILRLFVEKYDQDFAPILEQGLSVNAITDNAGMEAYIKMLTNQFLLQNGWLEPTAQHVKNYNLAVDRTMRVTTLGEELLASWKEKGNPERKISVACFARSQDVPLGTTFNVGMYSAICHLLGTMTNMVPWEYTHFMGDYHIYSNQVPQVLTQMSRLPGRPARIYIDPTIREIEQFEAKNVQVDYDPQPAIKFPMAAV